LTSESEQGWRNRGRIAQIYLNRPLIQKALHLAEWKLNAARHRNLPGMYLSISMVDEVQTIPAGDKVRSDKKIVSVYAVVTHWLIGD
jgi:hypothetical protein